MDARFSLSASERRISRSQPQEQLLLTLAKTPSCDAVEISHVNMEDCVTWATIFLAVHTVISSARTTCHIDAHILSGGDPT